MIRSVRIRGFKRFREVDFRLPGHVVLAGPNNTGKTTLLQAIASWALALRRWRELNDFNRRNGYRRVPIARQAFAAVPLGSFDLLWTDRRYHGQIEIELRHDAGWVVTMEFIADSTEQIYVRPALDSAGDLREIDLQALFVPPMTGLGIEEPVYQWPKIEQILGLGQPGEVLRNLLAEANRDQAAWEALQAAIDKLFGYRLLPPDTAGAHIRAEYEMTAQGPPFDVASAGSGFQQVLMLLAFLNTRHGAVLLLDEPDAHLHVILQDAIYHELRSAAARHRSQLIVATHSEVVHKCNRAARTHGHAQRAARSCRYERAEPTHFLATSLEPRRRDAGAAHPWRALRRGLHGPQHPAGVGTGARTPRSVSTHNRVDVQTD